YTMLAKISDSEPNSIAIPDVPPDDLYFDVFQAMSEVNDDKRRQMDALVKQQDLLQVQAAEIQEANTMLSERLQQVDEKNRQLALLNHEKNELMGIVAHDLKNPIGAVRGLADIILLGLADPARVNSIAQQIVNTSNRMLELVTNLLEVNRLEEGTMQLHLVVADVVPFVETSVWGFQHHAEAKNIRMEFLNEASQSMVLVDEQAITQVLDNLVSNAVKYSPHGTTIRAFVKTSANTVRVEIHDEGPGISEEDMKKLFGKFARLTAQPTGGEHSTGLGLSIVKKIVEAMNGKVWCESELGKGATFIVELPRGEISANAL
ncbi:MAG: sensor histidine kinase, partial [Candidatus Kapaibacteriota bacterium]